ncbi:MAG: recombination-associated protein RdgC [Deltaproteobacteria bacterium]|nr:recombination-associated protein RdgC [Deltaproteobacteria bacterium]
MGLYSGAASYLRYQLAERAPDNIKELVLERIKANAFKEIDPGTLTDKTMGWVSAENMASIFFDDLHFQKEPYLVFSLRIDTRKVPAITMKAARLREEIKYKEDTGQERLSKKDKSMLKDEVWQSLLRKCLPTPVVYEVCWNLTSNIICFFSTSKTAQDEFVTFFYRSFDIKLIPLVPYDLAEMALTKEHINIDIKHLALNVNHG